MPLFDYRCPRCGAVEERCVNRHDDPVVCSCGANQLMNKTFLKAPGVIMRPEGYHLRPGEPGYSKLPREVVVHDWQN